MEIYQEYGNRAPGNRRVLVSRGLYSCTIPNIANLATDGNQCHKMFILRLSQFSPTFLSPSHEEGEFGTVPNTLELVSVAHFRFH
jgi:hypothetical protein